MQSWSDALPSTRYVHVDGVPRRTDADEAAERDAAGNSLTVVRRHVRVHPIQKVQVLSQRPGLSELAALLGKPSSRKLHVLAGVQIAARLDCGSRMGQTVRAAPYFISMPWYDSVLVDSGKLRQRATLLRKQPVMSTWGR